MRPNNLLYVVVKCLYILELLLYMNITGRFTLGSKSRPQVQLCESRKPVPCAKICGISTTYRSCDSNEGYCNCPAPCPSSSRDNSQICRECRKPSLEQRVSCHKDHCKQAGKTKVEALVCTDKRNLFCTCFPTKRILSPVFVMSEEIKYTARIGQEGSSSKKSTPGSNSTMTKRRPIMSSESDYMELSDTKDSTTLHSSFDSSEEAAELTASESMLDSSESFDSPMSESALESFEGAESSTPVYISEISEDITSGESLDPNRESVAYDPSAESAESEVNFSKTQNGKTESNQDPTDYKISEEFDETEDSVENADNTTVEIVYAEPTTCKHDLHSCTSSCGLKVLKVSTCNRDTGICDCPNGARPGKLCRKPTNLIEKRKCNPDICYAKEASNSDNSIAMICTVKGSSGQYCACFIRK